MPNPAKPVRQYLTEAWNSYSQGVEKDRPPEQREILQMAFFAGASAFFFETMAVDFDEAKMQAMDNELRAFAKRMKAEGERRDGS